MQPEPDCMSSPISLMHESRLSALQGALAWSTPITAANARAAELAVPTADGAPAASAICSARTSDVPAREAPKDHLARLQSFRLDRSADTARHTLLSVSIGDSIGGHGQQGNIEELLN